MNSKLMVMEMMNSARQMHKPMMNACGEVDQQLFRQGMSNLGAAVNVITTQGAAGQAGFTASAVCSVTDTPPTLLVCLNRSASVFETFKANKVLCVNTLNALTKPSVQFIWRQNPNAGTFFAWCLEFSSHASACARGCFSVF